MKTKRIIPKIRSSAGSEYESLVSLATRRLETDGDLREWLDSMTIETDLRELEDEAAAILRAAGLDAERYFELHGVEPLSPADLAGKMRQHLRGVQTAIERNDARSAAWHALRAMENRYLRVIRSLELSTRIGQNVQRSPGRRVVSDDEKARMQEAAEAIWQREPAASKVDVAHRIATNFQPWTAGRIRKLIRKLA